MTGQRAQVLAYMRKHGSISSWEAFAELNITRLSARIKELRDSGYRIISVPEHKNGKHWTRYKLLEEN